MGSNHETVTCFGIIKRPEVLSESEVSDKQPNPDANFRLGVLLLRMQNRSPHARDEEDGISVRRRLAGVFIIVSSSAQTRNPFHHYRVKTVDPEYSIRILTFLFLQKSGENFGKVVCGAYQRLMSHQREDVREYAMCDCHCDDSLSLHEKMVHVLLTCHTFKLLPTPL